MKIFFDSEIALGILKGTLKTGNLHRPWNKNTEDPINIHVYTAVSLKNVHLAVTRKYIVSSHFVSMCTANFAAE